MLLVSAGMAASLLLAIAVQPAGASLLVLVALAAGIGLATPPVGACLRTQLPALLSDPGAVRAAYALEASVVELTYVVGPPLALCLGGAVVHWRGARGCRGRAGGRDHLRLRRSRRHGTGARRRRARGRGEDRCALRRCGRWSWF